MMTFPGISWVLPLFCHCNHPNAQPRPISLIHATPPTNHPFPLTLPWNFENKSEDFFTKSHISREKVETPAALWVTFQIPTTRSLLWSQCRGQSMWYCSWNFFLLSPFGSSNISLLFVETSNSLSAKRWHSNGCQKDNNAKQWPEGEKNREISVGGSFNFSLLNLNSKWEPDVRLWSKKNGCTGSKHPHTNQNTDLQVTKQSHRSGCY